MSTFIYLLRQLDRRLLISTFVLSGAWILSSILNTTADQLRVFQAQYPLHQQWRLSQECDMKTWLRLKESTALSRTRLKTVLQFLLQQFGMTADQIKIEESHVSRHLKSYDVSLLVGTKTDAELIDFIHYLNQELFPLVQIEKFSLHRSRTLEESMIQEGQDIQLIEGRLKLAWISK
ncbi:hypothetical protein [Candidatus Odyssella acanthamoebae]|uniref:Uncharacterized protein n=1 Tax=Candidatus Odyssella acanthamoebae TaxID=91604 RepID=A0A077AVP0_9PROT|nr:hypothetical protein [Candidatus Paracaedibacter acanthamoebae]AIK97217.1 hypothetical protein ID47_11470 [Candidatus Paracaedibacter acanthamoebae]